MEVNEVMVGDWVEDLSPVKLVSIDANGWCAYSSDGRVLANLENMKPIPLTDEIL